MVASEERSRILRMVAEGKVTPAEAEDLLSALDMPGRSEGRSMTARAEVAPVTSAALATRGPRRSLVIRIEGDSTKVNLRIPLGIARAAGRFLPRQAQEALANFGLDLEELMAGVGTGGEEGTLLEVEDGDDHVRIAVE